MDGIDANIISITGLYQFSTLSSNMFDVRYQMALNDFYGIRSGMGSITNYSITKQNLELISQILDPTKNMRFTRVTNKLYIDANWGEDFAVGEYILLVPAQ